MEKGNIKFAIDKLKKANGVYLNKSYFYGNIVYSLVEIKKQAANAKNIDISFESHNLNHIIIPSTDLAIIIGNALDNAIEECERIQSTKTKPISLFVSLKNDTVIIVIKNLVSDMEENLLNLVSLVRVLQGHNFGHFFALHLSFEKAS